MKFVEHVSFVCQNGLPPKLDDPRMFSIPCEIGNVTIDHAMLDLGASINVISFSTYKKMNVGPLHETRIMIQLADRSSVQPKGVVKDVLVKVGD